MLLWAKGFSRNHSELCEAMLLRLVLYLLPWWTELSFGGWCKISSRISDVCSFKTFAYHVLHSLCTGASLSGIMQMIFFGGSWRCELYLLGTHISAFRYLQLYIYIFFSYRTHDWHWPWLDACLSIQKSRKGQQNAASGISKRFVVRLRVIILIPVKIGFGPNGVTANFQLDLWHWRFQISVELLAVPWEPTTFILGVITHILGV